MKRNTITRLDLDMLPNKRHAIMATVFCATGIFIGIVDRWDLRDQFKKLEKANIHKFVDTWHPVHKWMSRSEVINHITNHLA